MMTEEVFIYCLLFLYCRDLSYITFDKEILPRHRETIRKEFSSLHI
jgi:hypothetical protein